MFHWNFSSGLLGKQVKARRPKASVRPTLEVLEDRTMPSTSALNPPAIVAEASPPPGPAIASVASPSPAPLLAAFTSYVASTLDQYIQLYAVYQQLASNEVKAFDQEIAPIVFFVEQPFDQLLGITPNAANPSPPSFVPQPSSNSGAGRGNSSGAGSGGSTLTTAPNSSNQPPTNSTQTSGSGSGSSSSTTTTHGNTSVLKMHPMTGSGGSGGSGSGGGGSGSGSNIPTSVSGQVWLDNNGDGIEDDGESGLAGITVELIYVGNPPGEYDEELGSTTTNANGDYSFNWLLGPNGGNEYFQVLVVFPTSPLSAHATIEGIDSDINQYGGSAPFALDPGDNLKINAGLCSMNVTTTEDDPNGAIAGQITLRDAIETGNNGDGDIGDSPIQPVTFQWSPQSGQSTMTGSIALQAALPDINGDYNIDGTGASVLTVDGGGNAGTIFTVNATSTISGLTITGGNATTSGGGGILNNGDLTLTGDDIDNNQAVDPNGGGILNKGSLALFSDNVANNDATDDGGGIYNSSGADLTLSTVSISGNTAEGRGGGLANGGTVYICCGSVIQENIASDGGGGIDNASGGKMFATDGTTQIYGNSLSANSAGGGVDNNGTFVMTGGSIYNNKAQFGGGGLANGGTMTLSGVMVYSNQASSNGGGGIYVFAGKLTLMGNTTIGGEVPAEQNKAPFGGGLYVNGGTVSVSGGLIGGNVTTSTSGGGIYVKTGKLTLDGAAVNGNTASGLGGGIFINGGTVKATNASIYNNQALSASGGGIYVYGGSLTMTGKCLLTENKAPNGSGGGMMIAKGKVTISGGSIAENSSGVCGGGIYNSAGTLTIQNNVWIKSNTTKIQGGGMYLEIGSTTTFVGNVLAGNIGCQIDGDAAKTGPGVHQQTVGGKQAIINGWPVAVIDKCDPRGQPVPGP
ncbi:MAG TPA: SdrD B-like domain-containing protein [Gemmataceae bacterium]|nr:SdrD B-like domain-containing protein [Gemmataceae bacterium]